jgi:ABC-type branched-subunit amino acid transport system substrate-binding protein
MTADRRGGGGSTSSSKIALNIALFITVVPVALAGTKEYGPGVTDTEIKLGQTMPYSGPISALSTVGKAQSAYFDMINAEGGVNGRKIKLISLDDGYNPAKTVEQTRKLIEDEGVLALFSPLGTVTNEAIHKYVNDRKVPHLFIANNLLRFSDPENYPWTIPSIRPSFYHEAKAYAQYILRNRPNAKIAILHVNEDTGKEYLTGLREGLGARAQSMLIAEATLDVFDPSIDSQIIALHSSGADTLVTIAGPKHCAMAIRKLYDLQWKPLHIVPFFCSALKAVLASVGYDKAEGLVSSAVAKDPADPQWRDDPATREYLAWAKKWFAHADELDWDNVLSYSAAQLMVHVLRQCGDDLSRDNLLRQATNVKDLQLPMMLPGIKVDLSPTDYLPVESMQMIRFDGKRWVRVGGLVGR